jgi:ATP-dependent Clp protease ATP-binding subunit ClpA
VDAPTAPRTAPASRPFAPDALRLLAEARLESTYRVFERASDTARELGHAQVEVAHLLVGIMREGVGAQVLRQNGLTAEAAYDRARATPRASP